MDGAGHARASAAHQIAGARRSFVEALRSGDARSAATSYTEDARLLAPSSDILVGRQAIQRFWQAGFDAGVEAIELESHGVELEPGGQVATEIGRYVLRVQGAAGGAIVDRGRYVLVYRRVGRSWRRSVETFSPEVAPTSESDSVASLTPASFESLP